MLEPEIKLEIYDLVPRTYYNDTISALCINKFGNTSIFTSPVVAVEFVNDNIPYYYSIDDSTTFEGNIKHSKVYMQTRLRFIVGAEDVETSLTTTYTYSANTAKHRLHSIPANVVVTDGTTTFVEDIDYRIINNIYLEWLNVNTPAEGDEFTVTYDTILRGSWLVDQILYELNVWSHEVLNVTLHNYDISLVNRGSSVDLSRIINKDTVAIRAIDFTLVYPDSWEIDMGDTVTPLETVDTTFI